MDHLERMRIERQANEEIRRTGKLKMYCKHMDSLPATQIHIEEIPQTGFKIVVIGCSECLALARMAYTKTVS